MDQSRRAVEAYWRSRMVDAVTADEDKVAPVYKVEEVCELLRTSPAGIVKEVSDYILKRIDHKSPVVKQKALRLIKYAVGKSGNEFRREMQRHSAAVRQLLHYKGQLDPLKGDALNKAVRDTAHEAIAAIFATDDNKAVAPTESLSGRIQGFGNANFEMVTEEKKSFLSEVVGLSSASIKQGLSTIAAAHSSKKNDTGSYKSPTLKRSLTTEIDRRQVYEGDNQHRESWVSSGVSRNLPLATWNHDSGPNVSSTTSHDETGSSNIGVKSREDRLLDTIVTSGGVRLQPTREAIQAFLTEASKLDALLMSHALEMKLQSHLWQVRMKAMCVLESILRKKTEEHFSIIASYFTENRDSVVKCADVPQHSLREKTVKVLSLLDDDLTSGTRTSEEPSNSKAAIAPVIEMPDLIDTGDLNSYGSEDSTQVQDGQGLLNNKRAGFLIDDLFGDGPLVDSGTTGSKNENDPFSDVSFHVSDKEHDDLFSGLTVDDKVSEVNLNDTSKPEFLDVFGDSSDQLVKGSGNHKSDVNDLMSGLNLHGMTQETKQPGPVGASVDSISLGDSSQQSQLPVIGALNGNLGFSTYFPQAPMQYNLHSNMFNQGYASQPINYGAMGAFIAQQQLLLQNLGNLNPRFDHKIGNAMEGSYSLPLPDIFQLSNNPVQSHASVMNNSKEETRAFDFISDHLASARDSKKIL